MYKVFEARRNHCLQMMEKNKAAGLDDRAMFWQGKVDEIAELERLFLNTFMLPLLEELEDYGKLGPRSIVIINDDNYIPVSVISRIIRQNANGEYYKWGISGPEKEG